MCGTSILLGPKMYSKRAKRTNVDRSLGPEIATIRGSMASSVHVICYWGQQCQLEEEFLLPQGSTNCWFTEGMLNGLETQSMFLYCWQCRALFFVLQYQERRRKNWVYLQLSCLLFCHLFYILVFVSSSASAINFWLCLWGLLPVHQCLGDVSSTQGLPSVAGLQGAQPEGLVELCDLQSSDTSCLC